MPPKRACDWQRLAWKNVKCRPFERAFVERRKDVGIDLHRTAPGIDEIATAECPVVFELAQEAAVHIKREPASVSTTTTTTTSTTTGERH